MTTNKVKRVKKIVLIIFLFLTLFFMLKAYSDLKVPYPLTDIVYVDGKEIRKKSIANKISMSSKAIHEMNKALIIEQSYPELKKFP